MIAAAAFYVFSAIMLAAATMVVTARNPVHSVLFLILAFFNAAALFLLAGAEFLAMILVIVYVGAVAVLFLFVVMMLDINFVQFREGFQRYAPIGATVGAVLLIELTMVLTGWRFLPEAPQWRSAPIPANISNTAALAEQLYTHNILLFQLAGLLLLVAMIGAIVLTLRERRMPRRQIIRVQLEREVRDTLEILQVPIFAGTDEIGIRMSKAISEDRGEAAHEGAESPMLAASHAQSETEGH
ncbi:MAG: NADH-quinone oxidoreductase subunit J [Acetobacteraceae bacterium]|nr:NADH-quinone oxidoreductase subunit J [Acetobacteraceae bacterium]